MSVSRMLFTIGSESGGGFGWPSSLFVGNRYDFVEQGGVFGTAKQA
jgi:hypothetical protein